MRAWPKLLIPKQKRWRRRPGYFASRATTGPPCTTFWPLVKTSGRPRAGKGVKRSLLGTIKVGSATQVTYAGHPLYTYSGDGGIKGSTSYVGFRQFGGVWMALRASGATVR